MPMMDKGKLNGEVDESSTYSQIKSIACLRLYVFHENRHNKIIHIIEHKNWQTSINSINLLFAIQVSSKEHLYTHAP